MTNGSWLRPPLGGSLERHETDRKERTMMTREPLAVLGMGLALLIAAPSGAEPKIPDSRDGGKTKAIQLDLTPRPDDVRPADAREDRTPVRNDYAGKPKADKPQVRKTPGKKMPNPTGTAPRAGTGVPTGPGGDIDPKARRANAAFIEGQDEDEEVALRPRPDIRPVQR